MPREFKIANCWKGRKLLLKMYLTEKCLAIFYQTLKKCKQMCKDEKCKIGPLSHFIEKTERKKVFQKVKKVKDLECLNFYLTHYAALYSSFLCSYFVCRRFSIQTLL